MSDPISRLSWDDLKVVKAIGEQGNLSLAAAAMGVNNSTIFRRLAQIEKSLDVALFDRRRSGYIATTAGIDVIALAQNIELEIFGVSARLADYRDGHSGDLRITTSDSLAYDLIIPIVADFKKQNPAIRAEVFVANHPFNLARGESDVAIRATPSPPENLYGRKVATIAWAAYRRNTNDGTASDQDRQWVSYSGSLSRLKAAKLVERSIQMKDVVYFSDSVVSVASAIEAGIGTGYLPCMLGDLNGNLSRVGEVVPGLAEDLWVLSHPDGRRSNRVQAFMTFCANAIVKHRKLIAGELPPKEGAPMSKFS